MRTDAAEPRVRQRWLWTGCMAWEMVRDNMKRGTRDTMRRGHESRTAWDAVRDTAWDAVRDSMIRGTRDGMRRDTRDGMRRHESRESHAIKSKGHQRLIIYMIRYVFCIESTFLQWIIIMHKITALTSSVESFQRIFLKRVEMITKLL